MVTQKKLVHKHAQRTSILPFRIMVGAVATMISLMLLSTAQAAAVTEVDMGATTSTRLIELLQSLMTSLI